MTLAAILSTTEIFIDANIFVYHFTGPTALTPLALHSSAVSKMAISPALPRSSL
jgi:hypothetical protein